MPYVLKHKQTAQIATDTLVNHYDLPYYGTKFWDSLAEAEAEYEKYLIEKLHAKPASWHIIEVEEMTLKMFNVKLKNDASLRLFLNEQGKAIVQKENESIS